MSLFGRGIIVVYTLTTLAVAAASWWVIEKPIRRFLLSLLPHSTKRIGLPAERLDHIH